MATKKKRICVSICDVNLDRLDELEKKYLMSKSKIVNAAISILHHLKDNVEIEYTDW